MRKIVWLLVIVLFVAHQDFWFWNDRTLVLGFMPIGLFYHAMFSLAAAGVWLMAVKFAWPHETERWADQTDAEDHA
jgi:hypothetical protein